MRRLGLQAREVIFVGDSPKSDIQGANRVEMISVLKDPAGRYDDSPIRPAYRIRRLRELTELVERHGCG